MDFCAEWLNHLLSSLDENCDSCLFENCAKLHYQVNGMDNILEKYVGNFNYLLIDDEYQIDIEL